MGAMLSQELNVVACVCSRDKPASKPDAPVMVEAVVTVHSAPAPLLEKPPPEETTPLPTYTDGVPPPEETTPPTTYTDGIPVDSLLLTLSKESARQSFGFSINIDNTVGTMSPRGLAAAGGLKKGDVILSVDGDETVKGQKALFALLQKVKAGSSVTLGVSRSPISPRTRRSIFH